MNYRARIGFALLGFSALGFFTHLIPHDMGVSTVGAIGMLSAAYLPRHLLGIPVLLTVLLVDATQSFYAISAMSVVYLGHVGAAYSARPVLAKVRPVTVVGAGLMSAVVFYLISNLSPMVMGYYPPTTEGWIACYINGLPFLLRGMLANLVFGGAFFGVVWLIGANRAHRFVTAERH